MEHVLPFEHADVSPAASTYNEANQVSFGLFHAGHLSDWTPRSFRLMHEKGEYSVKLSPGQAGLPGRASTLQAAVVGMSD
jgi:hypothetical protein